MVFPLKRCRRWRKVPWYIDGGIEGLVRTDDVQEVVRDSPLLLEGRLGRADVHPPIDLHGVRIDDFSRQGRGQAYGQSALAAGGRASNDDDFRPPFFGHDVPLTPLV